MKKIISIAGPTASGKTSFALEIAFQVLNYKNPKSRGCEDFDDVDDCDNSQVKQVINKLKIVQDEKQKYSGIDLISVDSRQVYKGLEILSGADVPEDFELVEVEVEVEAEAEIEDSINTNSSKIISPAILQKTNLTSLETADQLTSPGPTILNKKTELITTTMLNKKTTANSNSPFFKHKNLNIILHGVSIINLDEEWSVAHFKDFATKIILASFKNNRLPILVGGTGLYHQHLFNTDNSLYVPPNTKVREKADNLNVSELQSWLEKINPKKIKEMNNSDINNPRRLIRAIEISLNNLDALKSKNIFNTQLQKNKTINLPKNIEIITLTTEFKLEQLQDKILKRVKERFKHGAINEVKNLLSVCVKKDMPVCSTLGVSDISKFLSKEFTKDECIKNWALHEFQYAKRQLTWFKKTVDL